MSEMFERTIPLGGESGFVGGGLVEGNILLSEIFTGVPQFYPGSIIQLQEIAEIQLSISNENLISKDLNYFNSKRYLGSWQIVDTSGLCDWGDDEVGFIHAVRQKIKRYSYFTVVANPAVLVAQSEQFNVDSCNLYLVPGVTLFPGQEIPSPGFEAKIRRSMFVGGTSITKAPLLDTIFNPKIPGIGLYLKPGVNGFAINYKIAVINTVSVDLSAYEIPTCLLAAQQSCQAQFDSYIAGSNGTVFPTLAECQAVYGQSCGATTFICPTDTTQVFTGYGVF